MTTTTKPKEKHTPHLWLAGFMLARGVRLLGVYRRPSDNRIVYRFANSKHEADRAGDEYYRADAAINVHALREGVKQARRYILEHQDTGEGADGKEEDGGEGRDA